MLLEETLLRLRKYNLKLNPAKSVFGAVTVHYLGYNISGEGIHPGEEKMKAIKAFPTPDMPKKIREFVGLLQVPAPRVLGTFREADGSLQEGQRVQVRTFFCRRGRPKTKGTGAKPLIFPPPWGLYSFRCPAPQH